MTAETYLTTDDAAALICLSRRTLEKWRVQGQGPAYRKFGKKVVYAVSDLREWADSRRRRSTSEAQ